jgi:NADH-quinone oxidoreductase subunit N
MLLAVASICGVPNAEGSVYFYLFAYLIASFAVFGVMTALAGADDTNQELGDYAGLGKRSPFLAGVLACGLGSLAGIPPFMGFMGKLFVFVAAFKAGHFGLLAIAIAGVAISIYYYFGWIRVAYFSDEAEPLASATPLATTANTDLILRVALALLAGASVLLGFYQGPLGRLVSG